MAFMFHQYMGTLFSMQINGKCSRSHWHWQLFQIFWQLHIKMDEDNYVVVSVEGAGKLVTKAKFLHNTKITSSKMNEDKNIYKHRKYPQGGFISHMEMLHVMLKYPEVVTNIDFIKVSTIALELQPGIKVNFDTDTGYGTYVVAVVESFLS